MKTTRLIVISLTAMFLVTMLPHGANVTNGMLARTLVLPVYDVFAPTAYSGMYATSGLKLDGSSAFFGDANHPSYSWGMMTWGFTNPSYSAYWTPWTDRANFPPDNATILSVKMVVVVTIPGGHTAIMNASIHTNWMESRMSSGLFGPTALVHPGFHGPATYAMEQFTFDMTSAYTEASGFTVLGAVNWTPALIKTLSSDPEAPYAFNIRFQVSGYSYWTGYTKVDYLGIEYTWSPNVGDPAYSPPTVLPGANPHPSFFQSFGGSWLVQILAISMGAIGLIGMIAYPAAAIKNHKRGGDPSESLVGALTLEFIFIGMLYAGLMIA